MASIHNTRLTRASIDEQRRQTLNVLLLMSILRKQQKRLQRFLRKNGVKTSLNELKVECERSMIAATIPFGVAYGPRDRAAAPGAITDDEKPATFVDAVKKQKDQFFEMRRLKKLIKDQVDGKKLPQGK